MNNQKGFANIFLILIIVIAVGAVGYFAFTKKSNLVTQQPIPNPTSSPETGTPNRTVTSPTTPPSTGKTGVESTKTSTVTSHKSTEGGLSTYPDKPLSSIPTTPISVKFLAEHRTALNGKTVTVQGFVVLAALGPNACAPEVCQPRIFIADSASEARDKNYDAMVLVNETDTSYTIGQSATVKGIVASSKVTVYLTKTY